MAHASSSSTANVPPATGITPLRVITSQATSQLLADLAKTYSDHPVEVISVGGLDAAKRVAAGEPLDIVILSESALALLTLAGHARAGTEVPIAQSGIAIAVAHGAPKPDISNGQAVRNAVKNARSVGYSTGASGVYTAKLLTEWGFNGDTPPRRVQSAVGVAIGTHIVSGDVELGFQQYSELLPVAGIDIVGMLPPDIQLTSTFTGAICTVSTQAAAAADLLAYLASPQTADSKRNHGLEPIASSQ